MHSNEICIQCWKNKDCNEYCAAINHLAKINEQQKTKDKTALIRRLARQLNMQDAEPSKELKALGERIIKRFPEFSFIKEYDIRIGYVISYERKNGAKIVYADCRKLQEPIKAYLPFDFLITFYDWHTGHMTENQKKLLMKHELKHVGIGMKGLKITPHDIEDFKDILDEYGTDWTEKEVPDILAGE
jgi:hypothetical protein